MGVITVCDICGETILQPDKAKRLTLGSVRSVCLLDETAKSYDVCGKCLGKIKAALAEAAEKK